MAFGMGNDIHDTLNAARQEKTSVELQLRGGQTFKGMVQTVNLEYATIGPLAGREYFDAQVRIADICAVCVQVRGK
jgi:hypothetical protein